MLLTAALVLTGLLAVVYYKRKRQLDSISKMLVPWARLHVMVFTIYDSMLVRNEFTVKVNLESKWVKNYAIFITMAFFIFAMWDEYIGIPKAAKEIDLLLFLVGYVGLFVYLWMDIMNLNLVRYAHKLELLGDVTPSVKTMVSNSLSNLDGKFFHRIIYSTHRNNWITNLHLVILTFDGRVYTFENEKYDAFDYDHQFDRRGSIEAGKKGEVDSDSARV